VLDVLNVENGNAWIEIQAGLKGVVSRIDLLGDAIGDCRVEFEDCPALIPESGSRPSPTPTPSSTSSPSVDAPIIRPVKKRRGRPPKAKAVKHSAVGSDLRIPIEPSSADGEKQLSGESESI
jgi:hypothetical protein